MPDEVILNFSGDEASLKQSIEQAIATFEILKSPNFEKWFDAWEYGFPSLSQERGNGNYTIEKWRNDAAKRPRYREWTNEKQRAELGYRIIEYWKDRSAEGESIVLSGNDQELINHILQIEYEGGGSGEAKTGDKGLPPLQGQPEIFLYFKEDSASANNFKIRAEKSFRIMDRTDNPYSSMNKISDSDLRGYANKIIENFATGGGYVWQKGKESVSYKGKIPRSQGIDGWVYCKTKADGIALFDRIGAVLGVTIDRKFLRSTTVEDESGFSATPETVQILGKPYQLPLKRPLCDVRFQRAEIILPFSRQTIKLVVGGRIAPDLL